MSLNLTNFLQGIQGKILNWKGTIASREVGVVLLDSTSISWSGDQFGNISATATVSGLPTATSAGQVPTSTGAGTTYTAQTPATPAMVLIQEQTLSAPAASVTFTIPAGYKYFKLLISASNTSNAASYAQINFNGDVTAGNYYVSGLVTPFGGAATTIGGFSNAGLLVGSNQADVTIYYVTGAGATLTSLGQGNGAIGYTTTSGIWESTQTPASMKLSPDGAANFLTGSTFTLYGVQ
jgi:hypothetical protein